MTPAGITDDLPTELYSCGDIEEVGIGPGFSCCFDIAAKVVVYWRCEGQGVINPFVPSISGSVSHQILT